MNAKDVDGVIGREAGKAVKRMPSSVFWGGLQRWNILTFAGSLSQYLRSLDHFYTNARSHQAALDSDGERMPEPTNWHPHLPSPPEGLPGGASLMLDVHEATYLRERILSTCPGTLLAYLVDRGEMWESVDFVWLHDFASDFPEDVRYDLEHAQLFSEVMHGSARLYNVMLADAQGRKDLLEEHCVAFEEWSDERHAQRRRLSAWDLRDFWALVGASGAKIATPTRTFVTDWIERVRTSGHPKGLLHDQDAQQLIRRREERLKKGRARLSHRRHLELWKGDSGTRQLDFRWAVSQRLMFDIVESLGPSDVGLSAHA